MAEHMDSLSSTMDNSYDDVKSLLPCCSHITAIKDIVEPIDAVNGITADIDVTGKLGTVFLTIISTLHSASCHTFASILSVVIFHIHRAFICWSTQAIQQPSKFG